MASSFLLLLDDIAAVADDVATMSKMAFKKTVSVLSDDLALNAEQVSEVRTNRELPVVYGVFKGSLLNKLILVPVALLISYFAPFLLMPLLMIGGAYLSYEGVETVIEKLFHKNSVQNHEKVEKRKLKLSEEDLLKYEKKKIKGAVRTDFILSAEIVVITLSYLGKAPFLEKVISLSVLAAFFTIFVYGLVAFIVRLDDIGFWCQKRKSVMLKKVGLFFITVVPYLMRALSFIGLIAMFLVGGGIILHGIHPLAQMIEENVPSGFVSTLVTHVSSAILAVIVGSLVVGAHSIYSKMIKH